MSASEPSKPPISRSIGVWLIVVMASGLFVAAMMVAWLVLISLFALIGRKLLALFDALLIWESWQTYAMEVLAPSAPAILVALFLLLVAMQVLHLASCRRSGNRWKYPKQVFDAIDSLMADARMSQLLCFLVIIMALTTTIVVTLMGWRRLPEFFADWVGTIVGIMSTPILLEISFIFIGLSIVVALNHWRHKRAGDDYVELEVKETEE